jgi:hypothetical protein
VLEKHGIDLESLSNLTLVDSRAHNSIVHGSQRGAYYTSVNALIVAADQADGKVGVLAALASLQVSLALSFPCLDPLGVLMPAARRVTETVGRLINLACQFSGAVTT